MRATTGGSVRMRTRDTPPTPAASNYSQQTVSSVRARTPRVNVSFTHACGLLRVVAFECERVTHLLRLPPVITASKP